MELTHSFAVPAPIETTWAALNDLESIAPCMPGATVEVVDDVSFTGTIKVKLGPISLVYAGNGTYVERDEAGRRVVIEAKGKDKRGQGTAGATVTARLSSEEGGTRVEVVTDLAITGKPAQFGRGVIKDVSDQLLQQFVGCISDRLTATGEPAGGDVEGGSPPDDGAEQPGETATPGKHAAAPAEGEDVDEPSVGASAGASARIGPGPSVAPSRASVPDEVDLGSVVGPVLVRRYAVPAGVALAVALVLWRVLRRR